MSSYPRNIREMDAYEPYDYFLDWDDDEEEEEEEEEEAEE